MSSDPTIEQRLRDAAEAYPENVFRPLTDDHREAHPTIITLASAAMGRHFAPLFIAAADRIAELEAQLAELDKWRIAFENLTPNGSEFVNDLQRCDTYVRDRRAKDWEKIKELFKANRDKEAKLAAERSYAEGLRNEMLVREMAPSGDARKDIHELICWEITVHDDPRVSDVAAARDHYRQQVAELVEAVENMHPEDAASCRLWDRVRQAKHLAAQLKEQQDDR